MVSNLSLLFEASRKGARSDSSSFHREVTVATSQVERLSYEVVSTAAQTGQEERGQTEIARTRSQLHFQFQQR